MTVYRLNPLQDARWEEFLTRRRDASMFHTRGWLDALHRTYGYEPVVFTTSAPNTDLKNGLVFCQVKSWLTGRRLVSLPFSDHCQPLVDSAAEVQDILDHLQKQAGGEGWKYVEIRPLNDEGMREPATQFRKGLSYGFHKIDLRSEPEAIFRNFHDSCVRRKIRKAEREKLTYQAGRSEALLQTFHHLFLLTRRRHQLPPQPLAWFQNLIDCLGQQLTIHVASKDNDPVASILTVSYQNSLVYKYGCSNSKFNNLGGTPFLFWKAIQAAKEAGAEELDLGRSDLEDPGLADFKGHLGGVPSELNYYRYSLSPARQASAGPKLSYLRQAFAQMPDAIFSGAGRLLYRHMG